MRQDRMTYQAIAEAAGMSYGKAYETTKDVQLVKNDKLVGKATAWRDVAESVIPNGKPDKAVGTVA